MDIGLISLVNNTLELYYKSSHLKIVVESDNSEEILNRICKNGAQFLGFVNKVENASESNVKPPNQLYLAIRG